jgi:NADH:ubiquinone oxidoreductase subunit
MKTQIALFTYFRGQKVGEDRFGNVYYKTRSFFKKERRWVIYKGVIEASKVPPEWFGWLHFTQNAPLEPNIYPWMKEYLPNLSGTKEAYICPYPIKDVPKRHINGIQLWNPENKPGSK